MYPSRNLESMIRHLTNQDVLVGKQDQMLEKQNAMIEIYGRISENIEKLIQSINITPKDTERILDGMKEERKESRMAMDKILNTILKLVEKSEVIKIKQKFFKELHNKNKLLFAQGEKGRERRR